MSIGHTILGGFMMDQQLFAEEFALLSAQMNLNGKDKLTQQEISDLIEKVTQEVSNNSALKDSNLDIDGIRGILQRFLKQRI